MKSLAVDVVTSGFGVAEVDGSCVAVAPVIPVTHVGHVVLVEPVGLMVLVGLAVPVQAPTNSRATKAKAKQTLPTNTDKLFLFILKPLIRF
jgi:hypothetical protein